MSDQLFDRTMAVLGKVLDGAAARQRVLADNIANVETPNYIRKDLPFETQLHEAMGLSALNPDEEVRAITEAPLDVVDDAASPVDAHGNNVNIEHEMVNMAKNSLQYESASRMLVLELQQLRNAIHEGRR